MKGDIPAVAFKLLTSLPVRTHMSSLPVEEEPAFNARAITVDGIEFPSITEAARHFNCHPETVRRRIADGFGIKPERDASNRRPVIVDGKRFPSVTEAARELHIAYKTLYKKIDLGEASYA